VQESHVLTHSYYCDTSRFIIGKVRKRLPVGACFVDYVFDYAGQAYYSRAYTYHTYHVPSVYIGSFIIKSDRLSRTNGGLAPVLYHVKLTSCQTYHIGFGYGHGQRLGFYVGYFALAFGHRIFFVGLGFLVLDRLLVIVNVYFRSSYYFSQVSSSRIRNHIHSQAD